MAPQPSPLRVYTFSKAGGSAGSKDMKAILGGKGANLCEMARLGLNVPPGFTITTEECAATVAGGGALPPGLWEEVLAALKDTEKAAGKTFGAPSPDPLLLSVRSGAALSMPGMMDTVLNLGMNPAIRTAMEDGAAELAKADPAAGAARLRWVRDCFRRLLDMYGSVVLGLDHALFEDQISAVKAAVGAGADVDLSAEDLGVVIEKYEGVLAAAGVSLPDDPLAQLRAAIGAVFNSWNTPRAIAYRRINRISGLKGTACNIQTMVFGNASSNSGSGVVFTRSPSDGAPEPYGEFLANAQGEDVVSGGRTPLPIAAMAASFPEAYADLTDSLARLEDHYADMMDCEFTVQEGTLFMLQTRVGKRTGGAALRIATDLVSEGRISQEDALLYVEPKHLDQLLHPALDPKAEKEATRSGALLGSGLAASPGAAVGRLVLDAATAVAWVEAGKGPVILARTETCADDVAGMHASAGMVTARGGMTSHAAVVARGWGRPCVCGVGAMMVDEGAGTLTFTRPPDGGGKPGPPVVLSVGDTVSISGTAGSVFKGALPVVAPTVSGRLEQFLSWADAARSLGVYANADTPEDVAVAVKNGAEGVGLVRTEHMFFSSPARLAAMRRMIGAAEVAPAGGGVAVDGAKAGDADSSAAAAALAELRAYQASDFEGILRAAGGRPVTARILDPPLHEFLPPDGSPELAALVAELATLLRLSPDLVARRIRGMHEANPMLGFRGCRLGILHPEITTMQVGAAVDALVAVARSAPPGSPPPKMKIMVPLVAFPSELEAAAETIHAAAGAAVAAAGPDAPKIEYSVGTMIELPRAALGAADLATAGGCAFFSIGSNDLTQCALGLSRDDAAVRFLPFYLKHGLLPADPFQTIEAGVLELVRATVDRGRAAHPGLEIGVCGEHGGDPASIEGFVGAGVDYVSCSPLRVPVARLAAAQAAVRAKKAGEAAAHCQD